MEHVPSPRRPSSLGVLFLVTCALALAGLYCMSDYLFREMRRLEPWKGIVIWISDVVIFFWFCQFFVRHFVHGVPLTSQPLGEFKLRVWGWAVGSILLGMAADVGITLFLIDEEKREFAAANVVVGQAISVRTKAFPRYLYHELQVQYQDMAGQRYEQPFLIQEDNFAGFPPALPRALAEGIRKRQAPFDVRVSYHAALPDRSWLTDFGPVAGNRLHYFSLCLPIVQVLFLFLYGVILAIVVSHTKTVPWWFELHKLVPFLAAAVILAAGGLAMYLTGEWYIVWMWPE